VALAAMARRWHLTPRQFEAKLERLCRTLTGAAGPAAERMLSLWRERRGARLLSDTPTILVVEDDETIQALIYHVLRDDFRVVVAGTAREGLELAHTEGPAAITLDLMLPDAHGVRLLDALKSDPTTADIPVVVTSAYTGGLRRKDRELAAAVLLKPFDPLELAQALDEVVSRRRR